MKSNRYLVLALLLLLGLLVTLPAGAQIGGSAQPQTAGPEIESELLAEMASEGQATMMLYFHEKPDLSPATNMDWQARGWFVMESLQAVAERSQAAVRAHLNGRGLEYKAFWIDNIIVVTGGDLALLNSLQGFSEVAAIRAEPELFLVEPEFVVVPDLGLFAVEPNIMHISAPDVWAMGITGQGITIANIDSGVRYTHQALVNQYRGNLGGGSFNHNYNWWDPYGTYNTPGDANGHGTHVMGTMVGNDGGANRIGVAPDASWIACRGCSTSSCGSAELLACAEFIAAPWDLSGSYANPDLRPLAVNNSWGNCQQSYNNWYQAVIDNWHAAGVYPIFANGNASNCSYSSPPGLNTVGNPARYGNVTGVGSSGTNNGQYANHSNWGPTDNPDTVNPNGFPNLKPQVVAPGVNIRSSVPTSDTAYQSGWTGTSMSAPHVAGMLALVWQAAPCFIGDYAATETLIEQTATPIPYDSSGSPPPGPDNVPNYATGWGEINALAAVLEAISFCGSSRTLTGTVIDSVTKAPLAGAKILVTDYDTVDKTVITNKDGEYTVTQLLVGSYDITAQKFGYLGQTVSDVEIEEEEITIQNFFLEPAQSYTVTGVVSDSTTSWPLYARIEIEGHPSDPVWTDPVTGAYSLTLPEGSEHTLTVSAWVAGYLAGSRNVGPLAGNQTEHFALDHDLTSCSAPGYSLRGLSEDFNSGVLPAGWTIIDHIGNRLVWRFDNPGNVGNLTGGTGPFAVVNSDDYGSGNSQDTELRTPVLDFSAESSVLLEFKYDFNWWSGGNNEKADVDISVNGADGPWINVWRRSGGHDRGPATAVVDISGHVAGESNVMIRFYYYDATWEYWWQVDDIRFGNPTCHVPADGGLVVGNVYDANTGAPLVGATVENEAGYTTTAVSTPLDPNLDDAFYILFSPSGSQLFTATVAGYGQDVRLVDVGSNEVVRQDFLMPSGLLSANPSPLEATVALGSSTVLPLTLTNEGGSAAAFALTLVPHVPEDFEGVFTPAGWYWWAQVDQVVVTSDAWLSFAPLSGIVPADSGEVVVNVTLDATDISDVGQYTAVIRVDHDTPYKPILVPVIMTVEEPRYDVTLNPDAEDKSGPPGATVVYLLELTNDGNITDTFSLTADGWATLPVSAFTLAAGTSISVAVHINIPAGAADGAVNVATATATSAGEPTKSASSTLTTTVQWYRIFMPLLPKS
jgi:subtilisin family serine protease